MPLHRVTQIGVQPAEALAGAIARAEKNGEKIVQVQEWANEWLIITQAAPRQPKGRKPPLEMRGAA